MTLLLPLLAFLFVSLLVAAAAIALSPRPAAAVERRLEEIAHEGRPGAERPGLRQALIAAFKRLGEMAPKSASEIGSLQRKLLAAGYRRHEAIWIFLGIRVGFGLVCFAVASLPALFRANVAVALGAAGAGYLLPGMVLGRMARKRQHRIRLSLPDALDLLVVSVEAGLGLDQAILRVGDELSFAHPDLSEELRLVNLELRAGTGRAEALHNLATRTGVEDVASLVAMLVQTDKFGTSVAQSLRVHSETLRTKRRQRAEEAAAKTGVKMVFPLVFCIFPAIWVVTIGPAAIKFVQVLFPMAQGQQP
ncbi:MAG: type II secretion system F family protein [Vicinamibacterales bacterium]